MSDENERSVASAGSVAGGVRNGAPSGCETVRFASDGSVAGDRDIVARLRDWRSVHLARLHEVMEQAADEIELLRGYRNEAESEASIASLAVERLRLTDAERDAIQTAMNAYGSDNANPECAAIEATLWGLLERTK